MTKTTQAAKLTASWTPSEDIAEAMIRDLGLPPAFSASASKIKLNVALAVDPLDPESSAANAAWFADQKAELEAMGTVHTWSLTSLRVDKTVAIDIRQDGRTVAEVEAGTFPDDETDGADDGAAEEEPEFLPQEAAE